MLQSWVFENEVGELKQNNICNEWAERNANDKEINMVDWVSVSFCSCHHQACYYLWFFLQLQLENVCWEL